MRTPVILSLALLAACSYDLSEVEKSFRPHEDPFVLAYFEHLLAESSIDYTKNEQGYYVAPEKIIDEVYIPLGEKAAEAGLHTTAIVIQSECSLVRLKQYLRSNGVVYRQFREGGRTILQTTEMDSRNFNIDGHYAKYDHECKIWKN